MSKFERHFSDQGLDLILPDTPEASAIRTQIEATTTDDPDLLLETLPAAELARLKMHFIGWSHEPSQVPALVNQIASHNPAALIAESFGGSAELRAQSELMNNLILSGLPVSIHNRDSGKTVAVDYQRGSDDEELLIREMMARDVRPTFRYMDMSDETAKGLEIVSDTEFYGYGEIATEPMWYANKPYEEIKYDFAAEVAFASLQDFMRDNQMINDVSRIAANALAKIDGDVSIVIIHGSAHTPIARHFQKRNIPADLTFLDPLTSRLKKSMRFPHHVQAIRESAAGQYESETILENSMISRILAPHVQTILQERFPQANVSQVDSMTHMVSTKVIDAHRDEILAGWKRINRSNSGLNPNIIFASLSFQKAVERLIDQTIRSAR